MPHFFRQRLVKTKRMSLDKLDSCQATSGKKWFMRNRIFSFQIQKMGKSNKSTMGNIYLLLYSTKQPSNSKLNFTQHLMSYVLEYKKCSCDSFVKKWSRDLKLCSYIIFRRRNNLTFIGTFSLAMQFRIYADLVIFNNFNTLYQ